MARLYQEELVPLCLVVQLAVEVQLVVLFLVDRLERLCLVDLMGRLVLPEQIQFMQVVLLEVLLLVDQMEHLGLVDLMVDHELADQWEPHGQLVQLQLMQADLLVGL